MTPIAQATAAPPPEKRLPSEAPPTSIHFGAGWPRSLDAWSTNSISFCDFSVWDRAELLATYFSSEVTSGANPRLQRASILSKTASLVWSLKKRKSNTTVASSAIVFGVVPPLTTSAFKVTSLYSEAIALISGMAFAMASMAFLPSCGLFPAWAGLPWKLMVRNMEPLRERTKPLPGLPGS